MEEAEALTQRVAIIVGGSLRCLGTTQRLRQLYGAAYQLDVTLSPSSRQQFQEEVSAHFSHCKLIEAHDSFLKYEVPRTDERGERVSIGGLFRLMEAIKERFGVREYAVQETSLEQIFIGFARQQREEKGEVAGLTDIVNIS